MPRYLCTTNSVISWGVRISTTRISASRFEYDGSGHRENLTGDNRRQNRLVDAGYRLLRFTAADVMSAPNSVVALVRRALSAESSSVRPIGLERESIPSFPHRRRN